MLLGQELKYKSAVCRSGLLIKCDDRDSDNIKKASRFFGESRLAIYRTLRVNATTLLLHHMAVNTSRRPD
jgi:hypothetical protein